jgi:starch-binding outer membrane protein SusE/F
MIKNLLKYITVIGLAAILFSCEKDEIKVYLLDNPILPTIVSMPDLTLQQAGNAADTLTFVGTPVDPGFQASAKYSLEACATGNNFKRTVTILTKNNDESLKITVGDLNKILVKPYKAGQVSIDFRIRAFLVVDSGTGALGSSTNPLVYSSDIKTAKVTIY